MSEFFKIVIGDTWHTSVLEERGPSASGRGDAIDFSRVRDAVDIVIDGASISGRIDEDSIFFLVRDMLFAVERLCREDGAARVSFYEGPWELVLQRVRSAALITLYRGGRRPEVLVKDQQVPFDQVVRGILASSRELYSSALRLDSSAGDDPVIRSMVSAQKRVEAILDEPGAYAPCPVPKRKTISSTRWRTPRSKDSFSFGFQLHATVSDLLTPGRPQGSDLNALLFKGQHVVHARGRRLVLGRGFLFLQTERLMASLRQLLTAWEEGRPMSVRLLSDGLVVGVRLGRDDGLVVTLMDSADKDAIIVLNDLTPWEYADAVLGVARELRRLIVETNPLQRRNMRMESMSRELRVLSTWIKDCQRGAVINKDVERYRRIEEPRSSSSPPLPAVSETSRLRFQERWRVEVEGLDLHGTLLLGKMASISARGSVLGVDTETGNVMWRRETDRLDARYQVAGTDGLARAALSGDIEMLDLYSGVCRWRTQLSPRSGGAPVLLVVEHGPSPGLVVAAEDEKKLVALDMRTGEPRWRFATARGGRFALRRFGRLLYVVSNDGNLNAVDIEDGSLVWRFTQRTRFVTPPALSNDTLLAPGGRPGRSAGQLIALNAYSGERKWCAPLGGGALTSPIVADNAALVPIRTGQRYELVAVDTVSGEELWRKDCDGWASQCALMALGESFIINAAGGILRSVGARSGEERWTTILGPSCSDDVPFNLRVVLRGGMLFVPADTIYVVRPEDGYVIHSLGGEPPVPDLLQVAPSLAVFVGEDSGHIAMYDLSSRLSVVS